MSVTAAISTSPYMVEDIEAFAPDILVVETGERFLNRLMKLEMPEQQ